MHIILSIQLLSTKNSVGAFGSQTSRINLMICTYTKNLSINNINLFAIRSVLYLMNLNLYARGSCI